MQKRLVISLSLITVILGLGFFISGTIIQNSLVSAVNKLNSDENFSLQLVEYKRGIFSSSAELIYEDSSGTSKVTLKEKIQHGPIILSNTPKGLKINFGAGKICTTPDNIMQDKLIITTIVDFTQQATSYVYLKKVQDVAPSHFAVAWDVMEGVFKHDMPLTRLSGELSAPSIEISNDEWTLTLTNFKYQRLDSYRSLDFKSQTKYSLSNLSFVRQNVELIKIGDTVITTQADGNAEATNLLAKGHVNRAKVVDQKFAQEEFVFSATNVQRDTWDKALNLPTILNPQAMAEYATKLTDDIVLGTELQLEFPKHFTEALLSYLSFEIYRTSPLGKIDQRSAPEVLRDISTSIGNLVQDAVKNQIIVDKGSNYAINFDMAKKG